MRGVRDGVTVEWDISAVPADGGLPASAAIVSPNFADERRDAETQPCRLRCALGDLRVRDRRLRGPHPLDLPLHDQDSQVDSFLIFDGAVEATVAGTTQIVGPGTLISVPGAVQHTLRQRESKPVQILSLHTPGGGFANDHRPETEPRRHPLS